MCYRALRTLLETGLKAEFYAMRCFQIVIDEATQLRRNQNGTVFAQCFFFF